MQDKNYSRKHGKRHIRFDVKLTEKEFEIVKKKAAFMKMPVGRCVRILAVQGEVKYYDLKELGALKRSFLSIGNNLNQIAAVANASGSVYQKDIEDLQTEFKYFRDVMKNYLFEISPTYIS